MDSIWDVIAQRPIARTASTAEDGSRATPVTALLDSPFELHIGQEAVFDVRGPHDHLRRRIRGLALSRGDQLHRLRPCEGTPRRGRRENGLLGMHEFVLDQRTIGGTARGIGQYVFSMRELNPYPGTDTAPYAAIFVVSKVVAA